MEGINLTGLARKHQFAQIRPRSIHEIRGEFVDPLFATAPSHKVDVPLCALAKRNCVEIVSECLSYQVACSLQVCITVTSFQAYLLSMHIHPSDWLLVSSQRPFLASASACSQDVILLGARGLSYWVRMVGYNRDV